VTGAPLDQRGRLALAVQRAAGRLLSPVWVPAVVLLMRARGWRLKGAAATRRQYRAVWRADGGPILICANHLTMVDSAIVAWALGSPAWLLAHYAALPWNVPERRNFSASLWSRILVYLMKCVPVTRGGSRDEVAQVLERLTHLLQRGETVLMFPEGGRSRTGRVDAENVTYGIGRLIAAVPGCRVVCLYLRGEQQDEFGDLPRAGERLHVRLASLRPTTSLSGLRAARQLAQQVGHVLAELERAHFHELGAGSAKPDPQPGAGDARQ
jgi:1-acyl-sn-glycerol-3-phosphate acyltransferase